MEKTFLKENTYYEEESLNELFNMTLERLPQYIWLKKEIHIKTSDCNLKN